MVVPTCKEDLENDEVIAQRITGGGEGWSR